MYSPITRPLSLITLLLLTAIFGGPLHVQADDTAPDHAEAKKALEALSN